jgi:lysophospholipase L1-like esterase
MPNARARGVSSLLVDRSARRLISSPDQRCTPSSAPAPAGPELQLSLVAERASLRVLVDGAEQMVCSVGHRPGALLLASGVRRIQLHRVEVHPAEQAPFIDAFGGAARSVVAQLGAAALGAALGALALGGGAAWRWAAAPLLLLAPLHRVDLRGALDALRLVPVPDAMGPLTFVGPLALGLLTAVGAARGGLPAALLGGALSGALLMLGAGGPGPGPALLGATLPAWAALIWANTHPVRARPLLSWALCALIAGLGELGLRQTGAFALWSTGRGWARAQHEFAELLEIRQYKSYPSDGFPVRPPDRDLQRQRIVALGSSSTGGAYQMDDIALFWPRKLEEQLAAAGRGAWEVVNQGVGGWNSLHVRLYAESQIDRLDPDVFVVYLGHNDILTRSPAPYRELYARYRAGSSRVAAVSAALGQSRLYTGLRFSLLALRDGGGAVAVPVPDARDNLSAVFDLAEARGARVMLVSEGLNPDPQPMAAYGQMMQRLAEDRGGLYLDAATRLWETGDPDLFLDDCHLSQEGHRRLAGWIGESLGAAGWLDAPPSG